MRLIAKIGLCIVALPLPSALVGRAPAYRLDVASLHRPSLLDLGSPGFDNADVAYVRADRSIFIISDGQKSSTVDLDAEAKTAINRDIFQGKGNWDGKWDVSEMVDTSIVFDKQDRAYTLIIPRYSNLKNAVLLSSSDHCRTWTAISLSSRNAALEKPDGFNDQDGPPTLVSFENYGGISAPRLWLDLFKWRGNRLARAFPVVLLSDHSELVGNHSGAGNSTFTTPSSIFITYDTTDSSAAGTQSVALKFDRSTGKLDGDEVPIGRSLTKKGPDDHDIPTITADASGHLMIVIGAHHALLQSVSSLQPWSLSKGWTQIKPIGSMSAVAGSRSFSYASLNTSKTGTVNILSRSEGDDTLYQLVQFQKDSSKSWTVWNAGFSYRVIATPNRRSYGAWRQRVSVDHRGFLYLNFRYYPNQLTKPEAAALGVEHTKSDLCTNDRCWYSEVKDIAPVTLISTDNGKSWN